MEKIQQLPRILLTGLRNNGQNLIFQALAKGLINRGVRFKTALVGATKPLEPMHMRITKQMPPLLDTFLYDDRTLIYLLSRFAESQQLLLAHAPDGLFEGWLRSEDALPSGCALDFALKTNTPVFLTFDVQTLSFADIVHVKALKNLYPDIVIAGYFLCYGDDQAAVYWMKRITDHLALNCVGHLPLKATGLGQAEPLEAPPNHQWTLASRDWLNQFSAQVAEFGRVATASFALDDVMKAAQSAENILVKAPEGYMKAMAEMQTSVGCTLALPNDVAFHQYDAANLMLLSDLGMKLIFFNTLTDQSLPEDADGFYFGGGYPEAVVDELSQNKALKADLLRQLNKGVPLFAEGESLAYFAERFEKLPGNTQTMIGLIPGKAYLSQKSCKPQCTKVVLKADGLLGKSGEQFLGYWTERLALSQMGDHFAVQICDKRVVLEGYLNHQFAFLRGKIFFYSCFSAAVEWVKICRQYHQQKQARGDSLKLWI